MLRLEGLMMLDVEQVSIDHNIGFLSTETAYIHSVLMFIHFP